MPYRILHELVTIRPFRLFVNILLVIFIAEAIVMLVLPVIIPDPTNMGLHALLDATLLTLFLSPLLWYLIVRPLNKLADMRSRLLGLSLSAQEEERGRIARDLHDGLGQALTGLMLGLRVLEESAKEPSAQEQIRELRRIGGEAHDEVRRLARGLRPAVLDELGLLPALQRYCDDTSATFAVNIHFEHECPEHCRLADDVESSIFRIVQEAASNSVRHGKAKNINIQLSCRGSDLQLAINDDGRGFDVGDYLKNIDINNPFGIFSIQERARLLGGSATLTSQPGTGTQWHIQIQGVRMDKSHG